MLPTCIANKHLVYILILVVATLCLRIPGVQWGIIHGDNFEPFEPDEFQHIGIAKNLIHSFSPSSVPQGEVTNQFNARGLGVQMGILALLGKKIGVQISDVRLLLLGRFLSIGYSLLLVLVLYFFVGFVFKDVRAGFLSAILLAVSDLNITYSHYAVPEVPHVFWFFFSSMFLVLYYKVHPGKWIKFALGIGAGMSLSFKCDPSPFLAFMVILFMKKEYSWSQRLFDLLIVACAALVILLISWATCDVSAFIESTYRLWKENSDIIKKDKHFLYNPVLYPAALAAGSSCFLFVTALLGLSRGLNKKNDSDRMTIVVLMLAPCLLFLTYWMGDAPFVRRASVFVPFCALFSGAFIAHIKNRKIFLVAAIIVVGYTFLLSAFSQAAFLNETRYEAGKYLDNRYGNSSGRNQIIVFSPYSQAVVRNIPGAISMTDPVLADPKVFGDIGVVVLHETYYGRYLKYFTTPFRIPRDCDEVYHCDPKLMGIIQNIVSGRSQFKLERRFNVWHPLPERLIFRSLFGTYETFLGDVMIYSRSR